MPNRIWIELEVPRIVRAGTAYRNSDRENPNNIVRTEAAAIELMEARAKLASNMIRRLGVEGDDRITVMVDKNGYGLYCNNQAGGMFSVMTEGGVWLNLDFLGRE
jgi:hypothetical protein